MQLVLEHWGVPPITKGNQDAELDKYDLCFSFAFFLNCLLLHCPRSVLSDKWTNSSLE